MSTCRAREPAGRESGERERYREREREREREHQRLHDAVDERGGGRVVAQLQELRRSDIARKRHDVQVPSIRLIPHLDAGSAAATAKGLLATGGVRKLCRRGG